jgi:protein-disulfide isomerase
MHDKLFEAFAGLDTVSFAPLARQAGVPDIAAFSRCVARTDSLARVSRDLAAALDTLHISGTPTVLVNGKLYPFAPKLAELKKMIQDARDKKARTH